MLDREQLQANLYIAQGELEKAAKLTEEKFLSATTEIHGALMTLMEIALKEKRMEDAEYIADIDKQAAQVFDLWEYNSYGAQFQLYVATKKRAKAVKILLPMLRSLTKNGILTVRLCIVIFRRKKLISRLVRSYKKRSFNRSKQMKR